MDFGQFLRTMVLPALITAGVYVVSGVMPYRVRDTLRGLGLALGFGVALLLLFGWPRWPWTGSVGGLWWAVLAVGLLPLAEALSSHRRHLKRYLVAATLAGLIFYPSLIGVGWDSVTKVSVVVGFAAVSVFFWFSAESSALLLTPSASLSLFLVVSGGAALLMASEQGALLARLTLAYSSCLLVVWLVSWVRWFRVSTEHVAFCILPLAGLIGAHLAGGAWDLNHWVLTVSPLLWLPLRGSYGRGTAAPLREAVLAIWIALIPIGFMFWQIKGAQ